MDVIIVVPDEATKGVRRLIADLEAGHPIWLIDFNGIGVPVEGIEILSPKAGVDNPFVNPPDHIAREIGRIDVSKGIESEAQ